ncbi:MAG: bifunctional 3,4-dihydroxy-2-butanone-4-phosphate synthase/GTP cyclohydrolase II, partial [Oligoflexia bacterium]|nr:bifunctional 3,4-dihydroxy-2-butanone-4-phosphate synthase/GTP cyclohydrolase II [Oligoflexia bacterium]
CEIMKEDGEMARLPDLRVFAQQHGLRIVTVADLIRWRMRHEVLVERILEGTLPVPGLGDFSARLYRCQSDDTLHLAVWRGELVGEDPVLCRVQASDPVGDVFGSPNADSGAHIDQALLRIAKEGRGLLLYMHLGGGVNPDALIRRMRRHFDDVPQTPRQKPPDSDGLRELGTGAQILVDLGVRRLRLMTNSPRKIFGLDGYGLEIVERVALADPDADFSVPPRRASRLGLKILEK